MITLHAIYLKKNIMLKSNANHFLKAFVAFAKEQNLKLNEIELVSYAPKDPERLLKLKRWYRLQGYKPVHGKNGLLHKML